MRDALQQSVQAQAQGRSAPVPVPAPIGGWNTRDSIAQMDPTQAVILDNWFPRASEVVQRGGRTPWATGMNGTVQSIIAFHNPGGGYATDTFYGVTNAGIYDITAGGPVGAVAQALTNGYVSAINMTNSAGNSFLWVCNGVDPITYFNGTIWQAPTITSGPVAAWQCWFFKHRIFMIDKYTFNVYYLPIDSIQGAAQTLPVGNLFRRGGFLIAGTAWSQSYGEGPEDLMALISSEGELVLYAGTDPTSASSWGEVGAWFVGRPMGQRCFTQLGGDTVLLTENGVFPLSQLLNSNDVNYADALSNIIQPSFVNACNAVPITTTGFEVCVYPGFDAMIVNIIPPSTQTTAQQFVMNTVTSKWCSFSGWTPFCFHVFNGDLYMGLPGGEVDIVWDVAGTLVTDNGASIITTAQKAYYDFGDPGHQKQIALFRNLFSYSGAIGTYWAVSSDFSLITATSYSPPAASTPGAAWEVSSWETSSWAPPATRYKLWRSSAHFPGYQLSLYLQTVNGSGSLSWAGDDFILEEAGII